MASSSSTPTLWDVFLSFRGVDTRAGFTSHLYNKLCPTGIRTFIDEPELRAGDAISPELHNAIKQSKLYIVVLSENYASSGWCLNELVHIMDCKSIGRLVLPIFYKIDPSVVRYQNESFKNAFEKHEGRLDKILVNKWRATLKQVADLSGYAVRTEAAVINEIVERVLLELNPGTLQVAKYPVGIDTRVAEIESLLSSGSSIIDGVHWIGIHGMGGVGKTTLAKALYSQMFRNFQGSCFLADVKNVCGIHKGLESLQQQLIDDVLKRKNMATIHSIDGGINLIRERVCSLKILVVLDDLDHREQVDYLVGNFLAGSVIILTTRNDDLLDALNIKARYPVNELGDLESSELFAKHAFGDSQIPGEFMEMSTKIIRHAGGLPLALTVFGSSLFNLDMNGWNVFFYRIRGVPMDDVENKLMVSFNALNDPILKNLFLDIACFFVGEKTVDIVPILATSYEFIDHYISVLKKRCLITINEKDEVLMHDLLVEMGRKIARNSSPKNMPGKHSRLIAYEDIRNVLENNKGTEAIEGMFYMGEKWSDSSKYSFDAGTFIRMPNLRFLKLRHVNITGSFVGTLKNLRVLDWMGCPGLPSDFIPEKLVILRLESSVTDIFRQRNLVLRNLKILDMSFSHDLSKTPDFGGLQCLETLNFGCCTRLEDVHSSIGCLVKLVTLEMFRCVSLRSLPDTICKLRSLEILDFSYCHKLKEFAGVDSQLSNLQFPSTLKRLYPMSCSSLLRLPNLAKLKQLEILKLNDCSSLTEIQGLEELTSIKQLEFCNCGSLKGLPNLSKLKHLETLTLTNCKSLTKIQGLEELTSIKEMDLEGCKLLRKFSNLSKLEDLKILNLNGCCNFTEIPGLEDLASIEQMDLGGCKLLSKFSNLSKLENLKILNLNGCCNLTEIPGLEDLTNIEKLDVGDCVSLKGLPDLSKLKLRSIPKLSGCCSLREIQGLEYFTSVEQIDLGDCTFLKGLPNLSEMRYLKTLKLNGCCKLTEIQGLECLTLVQQIDLRDCKSLKGLPNLEELQQLEILNLNGCRNLTEIQGLEELTSIKQLDLGYCRSLKGLANLSKLKHLETLNLNDWSSLTEIQGLEELTSIKQLDLCNCGSLKGLPNLSNMRYLKTLKLNGCCKLTEIQGLEGLTLVQQLDLGDCKSLKVLPNLSKLKKLEILNLNDWSSLTEIQGLEELTSIKQLNFHNCGSLKGLPNLSKLKHLETLMLTNCKSLTKIQGLEDLTYERIELEGCDLLTQIT